MRTETGARESSGELVVVLLHGFMGLPEDLAPFARSIGVAARFVFPPGIVDLADQGLRGRAWWPIDVDARNAATRPRDLSGFVPGGLDQAHAHLDALLEEIASSGPDDTVIVGGFSQGAMLACDLALRSPRRIDGLVMFSGARIADTLWRPRYPGRRGLRTFASHGRGDDDLSFAAAESFQRELSEAGWGVTWVPFDGGHEIPMIVWRSFKRWLAAARP
ncbi:MAG: alpha/beta hydrolase [Polyangiaceae bacterium]